MSQNKLKLEITKVGESYSVEMRDMYNNYCCVYEPSVTRALQYADKWFAEAEKRYQENQTHAKAVMEMMALDRKAGILTGNYDGLD
tara:strand:+ start:618 stop:875 length:258 start_codon:yes stop_codon:yes gene_type:complete